MYLGRICVCILCAIIYHATEHAYALSCNVSMQYIYKDQTGKIKSCPSCRACPAGKEPDPPCGSVVGLHDQLRRCKPCKKNFYSAKKDFLPCQPCQKLACVSNEIIVGNCENNKPDTSLCTGHCKKGYIMNGNRSACVLEELKPSAKKDSGMPVGGYVGIAVAVVVLIGAGLTIYCYFKCRDKPSQRVNFADSHTEKKENNCCDKGLTEMKALITPSQDTEKKENTCNDKGLPKTPTMYAQEECKDEGQSIDDKPVSQESTGGFVATRPSADSQTGQSCV